MPQSEWRKHQAEFIARLERMGLIKFPWIREALDKSPRHLFIQTIVPPKKRAPEKVDEDSPSGDHLEAIYSDEVVTIRENPSYSSSSQPSLMLAMLTDLDIRPGNRVLEIGTGTGWNAALLACGTGKDDLVFSMDNQDDLVQHAGDNLTHSGFPRVNLKAGDGVHGWPENSPFDRIIVTASSRDIFIAWIKQLAEGGILLVPFRIGTLADPVLKIVKKEGMFTGNFTRWSAFTEIKTPARDTTEPLQQPQLDQLADQLQALSHENGFIPLPAAAADDWWHYFADLQFFLHLNGWNFHQGWLGTNSLYMCHEAKMVMAYSRNQPVLKLFGEDEACAKVRNLSQEWGALGSPGIEKYGVRIVPPEITAKAEAEWIERGAQTALLISLQPPQNHFQARA